MDRRALRTYGLIKLGIGVYCLGLPWLLDATNPLFAAIYRNHYHSLVVFNLLQFYIVGLLLIIPTAMMGATRPVLVRFLDSRLGVLSSTADVPYAIKSGGAFAGAMMAGLVLLPASGVQASYHIAIVLNVTIGMAVIIASFLFRCACPSLRNLIQVIYENPVVPDGWKGFSMQKRHGADQIVAKLRQAAVELGKGLKVSEGCKQLDISEQTYYRWHQKCGGMDPQMGRQFKVVQKQNTWLKKLVADQAWDIHILKEAARPTL